MSTRPRVGALEERRLDSVDVEDLRKSAKKAKDQLQHEKIDLVRTVARRRELMAEDALSTWVAEAEQALQGKVRDASQRGYDCTLVLQVVGCSYDLRQAILDDLRQIMSDPANDRYPALRALGPLNFGQVHDILAELGVTDIAPRPALKWVRTVREQLAQRSGLSRWLNRGLKLPGEMNHFLEVCNKAGLKTRLLTFEDLGEIGLAVEASW